MFAMTVSLSDNKVSVFTNKSTYIDRGYQQIMQMCLQYSEYHLSFNFHLSTAVQICEFFICLSGVTDLSVHDFVSFFISRAVPCIGPCVPFAPVLLCPRLFFFCFSLSMNVFAVFLIFNVFLLLY